MTRAIWNGAVIAQSEDTIVVEGNHYFPAGAVDSDRLEASDLRTVCGWKGTAGYYHVVVDGSRNFNAAWHYPDPIPGAEHVRGRIAFWRGVRIEDGSGA